jgi:cyclohexanecarboxylate-CoA ligase
MEGMALRVVDAEGRPLAIGQSGHLQVRGCSNFVGYLKRPQLYQTDAEGWFVTGDIARLDADGYLRITGRSKDVVIRGGENVPVVEIENLLFRHPKIREVAVVGRPDARLGERASAWVVVRPGEMLELADVTRYLAECGVSKTYFPEFLRLCNELPKTPSGKVQKFQLREMEKEKGEDPGPARGPAA